MEVEAREIRNEKQFLSSRSQTYGQYCCEDVLRNEQVPEVTEHVKKGLF